MRRETGIDFQDEAIELRSARGSNSYQSEQHVKVLTRRRDRSQEREFWLLSPADVNEKIEKIWRHRIYSPSARSPILKKEGTETWDRMHDGGARSTREISRLLCHEIYANRTKNSES